MYWHWPIVAAAFSLAAAIGISKPKSVSVPCLASTAAGDVQGVDNGGSCSYLGIPYGGSTAGANRWMPPTPATPWAPVVRPVTSSPNCPSVQPNGSIVGIEDCLRLNIWVKSPVSAPAPVLVWFHTGGFIAASANFGGTNGRILAEETGVIVVEPNYRLGPLGFLAHRALEVEDPARPSAGNYGLLDQRAALEWVRANIANFGGDPNNITIGGSSAGGHSVGLHLVSPGSAGLFEGAIIQSAFPTSRAASREEAFAQGDAFAARVGCTDPSQVLTCMRLKTQAQVLTALPGYSLQPLEPVNQFFWWPHVDGLVIPDQPRRLFEQGAFHHVPTLLGTNRDEGWAFVTRSYPAGPTGAQYEAWVNNEFGSAASQILDAYPLATFATPHHAMSQVIGDGQYVCETRRLADLIADGGLRGRGPHEDHGTGQRVKMPVFLYSYEYSLAEPTLPQVIHGAESNIIFGNNYTSTAFPLNHVLNAADLALHAIMAGYWSRFIGAGQPNADLILEWPDYRKNHESHMIFDGGAIAGIERKDESCAFWAGFNFRTLLGDVPAATP